MRPKASMRKMISDPTASISTNKKNSLRNSPNIINYAHIRTACTASPQIQSSFFRNHNSSPKLQPTKRPCRHSDIIQQDDIIVTKPDVHHYFLRSLSSPESTLCSTSDPDSDLLGDESQPYLLPSLKPSPHSDLKCISPLTLIRCINGEFKEQISKLVIVDARYPYEYTGGHIRHGVNLWTSEKVYNFFLSSPYKSCTGRRIVVVFYCEFSTMRGPAHCRFLRNQDRITNSSSFPKLHYPELYLLEGGYANFFQISPDHCEPRNYIRMLDKAYTEQMNSCQLIKHQGFPKHNTNYTRPQQSRCRRKQNFSKF